MRKEPFAVNSFVHIYNRGNRKQPIVKDAKDRWHFLEMLYYFNNEASLPNTFREIRELSKSHSKAPFSWLPSWPPRKPIVKILTFALMDNHFHLLLKEIQDEGISLFMRKLGTGMANYFNVRYQETGRLFQGSYKAKAVDEEVYLQYMSVYIQVKNPFELYPGGIKAAIKNFDKALEFAGDYPYCSLGDYIGRRNSPILDKDLLCELFPTPKRYKEFARECMFGMNFDNMISHITFDE